MPKRKAKKSSPTKSKMGKGYHGKKKQKGFWKGKEPKGKGKHGKR